MVFELGRTPLKSLTPTFKLFCRLGMRLTLTVALLSSAASAAKAPNEVEVMHAQFAVRLAKTTGISGGKIALAVCAGIAFVAGTVLGALVYRRRQVELDAESSFADTIDFENDDKVFEDAESQDKEATRPKRTGYRRGDMIAARRPATPGFCIASITRVHRDEEMKVDSLTVRWYRPYGARESDRFAASYTAAWSGSNPSEDRININSVFVRFDSLNLDNSLPMEVRKSLGDPTVPI